MNVEAVVNHGRWIAACPSDRCYGAVKLFDKTAVICDCTDDYVCDHIGRCNQTITPLFPPHSTHIEDILIRRPKRTTRNWVPGETIEQLQAENLKHGVRI